jgi:tripartite-type tricarboxylate transporter receptor subunit TctC
LRVDGFLGTHVINGALYKLPYDVLRDFEPIALLASNPQLIVAKRAMPAKDLRELIGWLKANPDKASQGTAGVGSPAHVTGVFFQSEAYAVTADTRLAAAPEIPTVDEAGVPGFYASVWTGMWALEARRALC